MVKIRIQGRKTEISWFIRVLSKVKGISLVDFSEPFENTDKVNYRVYGTIGKVTKSDKKGE